MKLLLCAFLMLLCVSACFKLFMTIDIQHGLDFSKRTWVILLGGSIAGSYVWLQNTEGMSWDLQVCWFLLCAYYLCCAFMDYLTCQVYDILQYVGIAAAVYLLKRNQMDMDTVSVGISLILFALLQYFAFMKLYGKADGMVFLISALVLGSFGYDINLFLVHMIISYLLLSAVQGVKGNIGAKGRLKVPVPFIPYITVSMGAILMLIRGI